MTPQAKLAAGLAVPCLIITIGSVWVSALAPAIVFGIMAATLIWLAIEDPFHL